MTVVYGEVLQRQGTWVKRCESRTDAWRFVEAVTVNEIHTVNPVRDSNVREYEPPTTPTKVPDVLFDDREW